MEDTMTRRSAIGCVLVAVVVAGACDLLNPARPAIQADTTLFGNLLEVDRNEGDDEAWRVRMRIGVPRALAKAEAAGGQPTPTLEEGLVADVRVTTDTVVLVDGAPFFIEDVNPGTEIVVLPVAGTTRMVGTSNITVDASYLTDFTTYRRWQLPGLPVVSIRQTPTLRQRRANHRRSTRRLRGPGAGQLGMGDQIAGRA
jgi:hypothetical protein